MENRSVVLWYLQSCMISHYLHKDNKKELIKTLNCTAKVNLKHEKLDSLIIAAPVHYFQHLTILLLQRNCLSDLPSTLWQLTNLVELNLGYNALTELPAQVGQLQNLRELYVHNNRLQSVPMTIEHLLCLETLDLTGNQLKWLPAGISTLPHLTRCWVDDNAWQHLSEPEWKRLQASLLAQAIPSLRDLCLQSVAVDYPDENDICLPPLMANELEALQSVMAPRCNRCSQALYFSGIPLLRKAQDVPWIHSVCSQSCRNAWLCNSS